MKIAKLSAALATGALLIVTAHAPAFAASRVTDAFLANLTPNVDFLDRSSRLALTNSKNAKLKDYAWSEARNQTLAANAIDEWVEANKGAAVAAAVTEVNGVMTGRSVAIDPPAAAPAPQTTNAQVADTRLPRGQEDIDSLEGLEGAAFDDQYKSAQLDALTQVAEDYRGYLENGDDPALRKMAKGELPKIETRLAILKKL